MVAQAWRALVVLAVLAAPAAAQPLAPPVAPPVAPTERQAEIARVEAYLNTVVTLRGRFVQTASTGEHAEGSLYIARPGKLRLDYRPPPPLQVVTDGGWLVFIDHQLSQVTRVSLSSSPVGILVRDPIRFSGDIAVVAVDADDRYLGVTVKRANDPDAGQVRLDFDRNPLVLRQWVVTDPLGVTVRVSLVEPEFNVKLDPAIFVVPIPQAIPNE